MYYLFIRLSNVRHRCTHSFVLQKKFHLILSASGLLQQFRLKVSARAAVLLNTSESVQVFFNSFCFNRRFAS